MDTTSTSTPAVHGIRPFAERVVDGDTQTVSLDLAPLAASILEDLARALHRSHRVAQLLQLATEPHASEQRAQALAELLRTVGVQQALQVTLTVAQAEQLAEDLDAATYALDECVRDGCTNLADSGDSELCAGHHDAATLYRAV